MVPQVKNFTFLLQCTAINSCALQLKVKKYIYIYIFFSPSLYFFIFFFQSSLSHLSLSTLNSRSTVTSSNIAGNPLKVVRDLTRRYRCWRRIFISLPLPCSLPSKPSSNSSYLKFFLFSLRNRLAWCHCYFEFYKKAKLGFEDEINSFFHKHQENTKNLPD